MTKKLPPPPGAPVVWRDEHIATVQGGNMSHRHEVAVRARDGGDASLAALIPKEEAYVFDTDAVREISWAVWPTDGGTWSPVLLTGPKGAGKTTLIEQIAARCGIPVMRVNLTAGTTVAHLKGYRGVRDGSTVFHPGVATRAMEAGAWLLLDEVAGATPHVGLALHPVLEPNGAVYLEDAEPPRWVQRHPDFRVFMTDNVIGHGQEDDRFAYSGTNPDTNVAFLDRVSSCIHVGYLPPEAERAVVRARAPHVDPDYVEFAVTVANRVRAGKIGVGFSTRMVIDWSRRMTASPDVGEEAWVRAAQYSFLNKMSARSDADAVIEVIKRVIGGGKA